VTDNPYCRGVPSGVGYDLTLGLTPAEGQQVYHVRTRPGNRRRIPIKCEVCGRFLRDTDPYGDFHTSHAHPVEYEHQMAAYRARQHRGFSNG